VNITKSHRTTPAVRRPRSARSPRGRNPAS
jgi:hypothetical protein